MTNNTPDSKLDEAVKSTLKNYEAPFDSADWSRMENMLDAAPKSGSFKWSYAIGALLGIAVIGGGYFIYHAVATKQTTSAPAPQTVVPVAKTITPAPKATTPAAPLTTPPVTVTDPATTGTTTPTQPAVTAPETKTTTPAVTLTDKKENKSTETVANKGEKTSKLKTVVPVKPGDDDIIIHQKVVGMGSDAIFGDMIDPSKGIVGETKEKDETKKAATTKKAPVAWDAFMLPNVNPDSLRKYREKRDSAKVNN